MRQSILTSTFITLRHRLRQFAAGILGDGDEAEDVVHEAFCRLWLNNPDVKDEVSARRLSYTAVRNMAIDAVRHSRTHPHVSMDQTSAGIDIPEDDAGDEDERMRIYKAVVRLSEKALSPRQFEVFSLHDIQGLTYSEVAEELGMTQENVRVTLSRVRKTIRELYRKQSTRDI